jgi:hypothetical protein
VLPNREYVPGIKHDESLRNLVYPLPWQDIIDYVGLPCVLKDAHGGGWKDVFICHTLDDLIANYNTSGRLTMVVQEFIQWDHFVRCLCIGQHEILPIKYDPKERKYHVEHQHMSAELGERVVRDARCIVRAFGYDMNSIEFAIRDGVPYAIDFMNPAPDMDVNSLTPHYFDWAVNAMADMAIRLAQRPPRQTVETWEQLFTSSSPGAALARPRGPSKKTATPAAAAQQQAPRKVAAKEARPAAPAPRKAAEETKPPAADRRAPSSSPKKKK